MIKALIVFGIMVIIYIGLYVLNKHIPEPEGCEVKRACMNCHVEGCIERMNRS